MNKRIKELQTKLEKLYKDLPDNVKERVNEIVWYEIMLEKECNQ